MIVVIVGPTASGKSSLGVALAKKFNGEILSADSRQIYRGLDKGSGKITKKEMAGVPHHLLSFVSPKRAYSVSQFQQKASEVVKDILSRGRVAFIVGGSAQYVYSLVDGYALPEVPPNPVLRKRLGEMTVESLYGMLSQQDPERASFIDSKNPRRIIRALEIISATKKPVPPLSRNPLPYPTLFLGIARSKEELQARIQTRLLARLRQGMVAEVARLHAQGLSWKRFHALGLEYRSIALYLRHKLTKTEMMAQIQKASEEFARHQMNWFKKDKRIHWISTARAALPLVRSFLTCQTPGV